MRQTAFALISTLFVAASLPAADQQLVNMVMPDAKVIAGINVDSARNSPFGTFLLRQTGGSSELQKFVQASGFNPQTDLNEVLIATVAAPPQPQSSAAAAEPKPAEPTPAEPKSAERKPERKQKSHLEMHMAGPNLQGLLLARGNFNVEKISTLAKTEGKQTVEQYNGATLVSDPKNPMASAMAFVGNNIVVAGDLTSVKAAIDRRNRANALPPQLTTKVNSLSASQDAWAVSIAPMSSLGGGPAADPALGGALNGDLFKKITETSGGIKFGAQIQLSTEMVAADEKNATALGDVMKFLVGMATMNAGTAKGAPPAIVALLQSLTVQTQGNVVNMTISAPEDQIESLINSMQQPPAKPGAKI